MLCFANASAAATTTTTAPRCLWLLTVKCDDVIQQVINLFEYQNVTVLVGEPPKSFSEQNILANGGEQRVTKSSNVAVCPGAIQAALMSYLLPKTGKIVAGE
ncbi:unnamed protein product [Ceratitis capitata]|uniref:(Mediterranean fruit fly) hypothetical protein n=1 Tax=Ceratitis capitata TaxID=7213 RepID=A0A811UK30_CERCA|nr:unnamed protein product [Ceratitis capitata]